MVTVLTGSNAALAAREGNENTHVLITMIGFSGNQTYIPLLGELDVRTQSVKWLANFAPLLSDMRKYTETPPHLGEASLSGDLPHLAFGDATAVISHAGNLSSCEVYSIKRATPSRVPVNTMAAGRIVDARAQQFPVIMTTNQSISRTMPLVVSTVSKTYY